MRSFDNINHDILMEMLKKRIEDTQFLNLIRDMLEAGYVEDWQYHKTHSGTPQGGIICRWHAGTGVKHIG